MSDSLSVSCDEWRDLCEQFPVEMEFVKEMLTEAEEELCEEVTALR